MVLFRSSVEQTKTQAKKRGASMKCNECNHEVGENDNFCGNCGTKLHEYCPHCFVENKDNYSCGEPRCPGGKFFLKLKSRAKGVNLAQSEGS